MIKSIRDCIWCQHKIQEYVYIVREAMYQAWLKGKGVGCDKNGNRQKGNRLVINGVVCYDCLKICNMNDELVLLDDITTKATRQAGGMTVRVLDWHFQRSMMTGSSNKNIWTVKNTRYIGYVKDMADKWERKRELAKKAREYRQ